MNKIYSDINEVRKQLDEVNYKIYKLECIISSQIEEIMTLNNDALEITYEKSMKNMRKGSF